MSRHGWLSPSRGWTTSAMACVVALLAIGAIASVRADRGASDSDSLSEESVVAGLDQSILDSAAQEIQAQLDLENELNARSAGESQRIVDAQSPEAATLDISAHSAPMDLAFIAELEQPVSELSGADVEAHLDTIATELDSLFKTDAQLAAEAQAKAEAEARANSKAGRLQAKRAKAKAAKLARQQARREAAEKKAAAKAAAAKQKVHKPSARQQKLVQRIDGYRNARGHADISTLEATAHTRAAQQSGYSMPSAFTPASAGGIPPSPAPQAFQGQVGYNPLMNNGWLGVPQQVAAAPVAAPAADIAGVGTLLRALKGLQEQQETASLLRGLNALLHAPAPAPAAIPAVVASPFNYGQSLVATPVGYVNPNLAPSNQLLATPRVLPGAVPGWSPSYPSFIPGQQANVGVADEQPNPFQANAP